MNTKNPTSMLYELSIKTTKVPPTYNLITHVQGTHENKFEYQVSTMGVVTNGMGRSKKEAKQEAASKALNLLEDNPQKNPKEQLKKDAEQASNQVVNYVGLLGNFCLRNNLQPPEFNQISAQGPLHLMKFSYECHIRYSIKATATASAKRKAKQMCAETMLEKIKNIKSDLTINQETGLKSSESQKAAKYPQISIVDKLNLNLKDYSKTLRDIMKEKGVSHRDIEQYLKPPFNEFKLDGFVKKFKMSYFFKDLSENSSLPCFVLNIVADIPLASIAMDADPAIAKEKALQEMGVILQDLTRSL